jgi:hypothetical protein
MPAVISKDWGITARNVFHKLMEEFYVRSGSHCLGVALVGTVLFVVASPSLRSATLSSKGVQFLLSAFAPDPVQRLALTFHLHEEQPVDYAQRTHDSYRKRSKTLRHILGNIASTHQHEYYWLAFAAIMLPDQARR